MNVNAFSFDALILVSMIMNEKGRNLPHIIFVAKNWLITTWGAHGVDEVLLLHIDKLNMIKLTSGVPN